MKNTREKKKEMVAICVSFFDEFNGLPAEEILARVELAVAKDGKSYVCPNPSCEHGKGGDGIRPRTTTKGQTRWHCFGCGTDYSNFDLAGAVLGLNPENDKAELAKRLKELFNVDGDEIPKQSARRDKNISGSVKTMIPLKGYDKAQKPDESKAATVEPKNFAKLFDVCRGNRAKFLADNGGSYRAITAATFEKYGVEVHFDFEFELKDGSKIKSPALIIPYVKGTTVDNGHFVARSISDTVKAFSQHGKDAPLYEPLPISADNTINFIVESELDALSIAQIFEGDTGVGCAATGGAGKWRKVVGELTKRFGDVADKPQFVVLFDNDERGKLNASPFVSALRSAGFPAEFSFLEGALAGTVEKNSAGGVVRTVVKIDANDLLKAGKLKARLFEVLDDTGVKLDEQAQAMRASFEQAKSATANDHGGGIDEMTLAEYFKADFFADMELTAKYATRSTGFEILDAAQVFLPGLYVIGAKPGFGKTTFVWQLLNQLADAGEFCVFASYEMSRFEMASKMMARELFKAYPDLSRRLNLSSTNIRRGAGKGLTELVEMAASFERTLSKSVILQLTNTDIPALCKRVRELSEQAQKPCTLAVDYLQIAPSKNPKATTKEKIDDAMLCLKNFQRDTGATVVVISAFNRENGNDAKFSSFRESSAIEYSADCLWALQRTDDDDNDDADNSKITKPRPMDLSCLKNRFGATYMVQFDYFAAFDYFKPSEGKKRSSYGH